MFFSNTLRNFDLSLLGKIAIYLIFWSNFSFFSPKCISQDRQEVLSWRYSLEPSATLISGLAISVVNGDIFAVSEAWYSQQE